jgi:serine/threonine protein kinase
VKPSNVLLDEGDWVLLTDFGLARMIAGETRLTATGVGIGTPAYMSPEQGKGEKVDQRTDIYSLGVILYEMATGRVPYEAETPLAVVLKHVQGDLSLPRSINPDIPEEDRYDSAGEMAEALKRALEAPVALAVPVAPPKPEPVPAVEVVKPGAIVEEAKRPIPWLPLVVGGGVAFLLLAVAALLAALLVPRLLRPRATPMPTKIALPSVVSTAEPTATPVPSPTAPSAALATSTKAPTPTPTPMAKATAIPQPTATSEGGIIAPEPRPNGPLVFEDDFSGGANGVQPLFKDEWMAFDYVDGKGRLTSSYKGAVMPAMYPALHVPSTAAG